MGDPDEFKAFEAEGWSARAGSYDRLMGRVTDRVAEALLDAAGVRRGDRVLDVATGTGAVAAAAVARGALVTGVDISEEMLAVARERVPEARFLAGDAEALAVGEGFDVLVAAFLINHLPHPERAVESWTGALTPGGRLVLSLWDRPERNRLFGLIGDAIGEIAHDAVPSGPDPYRFAAREELEALLAEAGLADAAAHTLRFDQPVDGPDQLWEGLLGGSVRSAARVHAQPAAERERARERLRRLADECRDGDRLAVPVCVTLGRAVRARV